MSKKNNPAAKDFGAKGWGIMALTFFSILLMSNIIYDSLNVTIPAYGANGWNMGILYMFSTVAAWISVIGAPLCEMLLLPRVGLNGIYLVYAVACVILAVLVWIFVRDYPEEKGAFPDNNPAFDKAGAEAEHKAALEYMKNSPWTGKRLIRTPTVWKMTVSLGVMELLSLGMVTPRWTKTSDPFS